MPLKDSVRWFKCKYCGREYQMFERADGTLIAFPDGYPIAIHGEQELMNHVRQKHRAYIRGGVGKSFVKITAP